ncbi:hypothetical protein WIW50_07815 [Flavobacteriaceae bacterium 3-367]
MKKVKILLLFVYVGYSVSGWTQHEKKEILLSDLEIYSEELKSILQKAIEFERGCDYYHCDLIFAININNSNFYPSFTVESLLDRNVVLGLEPYGYLYVKNHLFIVDGDKYDALLRKKGGKKKFEYVKYDSSFEEYDSNGNRILRIITDDSFSIWEYEIVEGAIKLVEADSSCGSKNGSKE